MPSVCVEGCLHADERTAGASLWQRACSPGSASSGGPRMKTLGVRDRSECISVGHNRRVCADHCVRQRRRCFQLRVRSLEFTPTALGTRLTTGNTHGLSAARAM
jgi:hypothetical protein